MRGARECDSLALVLQSREGNPRGSGRRVSRMTRHLMKSLAFVPALLFAGGVHAAELDPKAVVYTLPENIKWVENKQAGNAQAVIAGDPSKPGLYVVLTKWMAGNHFSRPHFH